MKDKEFLHLVRIGANSEPSLDYGGYSSEGVVGEYTGYKDVNGEKIHVGDMLKMTKPCGDWWSNLVVKQYKIEKGRYTDEFYYTINGVGTDDLEMLSQERKIERVMPYDFLKQEFRRFIHYIVLSEKYMDTCWDFVNGEWTKVK